MHFRHASPKKILYYPLCVLETAKITLAKRNVTTLHININGRPVKYVGKLRLSVSRTGIDSGCPSLRCVTVVSLRRQSGRRGGKHCTENNYFVANDELRDKSNTKRGFFGMLYKTPIAVEVPL